MSVPLIEAFTDWECPNCPAVERGPALTPNASRFHECPGVHGLTAPLVRAGSGCRITAVKREDYLGGEQQRRGDDGCPYMAVVTEHSDGRMDAAVFPGVAIFGVRT